MKVRNKELYLKWKRNNMNDGYGVDIFKFAEKWANLMEEELNGGNDLEDIVDKSAEIAGEKEITKTMFDLSLNILIKCWIYGYELEKLYKNKNKVVFGDNL